ncbi:hypothetical protein BJX61DRAFT_529891 [Aspergillus egyptiacus]|nr:hypothetical protein BJX61DRAFT_529891 [Aspergillus egyptiacus]
MIPMSSQPPVSLLPAAGNTTAHFAGPTSSMSASEEAFDQNAEETFWVDPYDPGSGYIDDQTESYYASNVDHGNRDHVLNYDNYRVGPDQSFSNAFNAEIDDDHTEVKVVTSCDNCLETFPSNNALHRHLPCRGKPKALEEPVPTAHVFAAEIVKSTCYQDINNSYKLLYTY